MPKWDTNASKAIQTAGARTMWFWSFIARFGVYAYLLLYLAIAYMMTASHRAVLVIVPVIAALIVALIDQYVIRRPRPVATKTPFRLWLPTYSFPSAHSTISFAFATSFSVLFLQSSIAHPWAYVAPFFALAICIALSRIIVGVHYLSDVVTGALLGILISVMLSSL